ncbi:hypothetical protein [Photobacterium profundum]|uniref:hypothetical protein n=1 Tax=Photobacterium profundum TaxID=74109 RepID=UPI003D0D3A46
MLNHEARLNFLSSFLSVDLYVLIRKYKGTRSKKEQMPLSLILVKYVELMHEPFNNDDTNELIRSLNYIRADLCQRHSFKGAQGEFTRIRLLIEFMMKEGCFKRGAVKDLCSLICTPLSKPQYEANKFEKIPVAVSVKFKYDLTVADITNNTNPLPPSIIVKQRLEYLSGFLDIDVYDLMDNFVYRSTRKRQTELTSILVVYIEVLHATFNNNDTDKLVQSLTYIRADLCQRYALISIECKVVHLRMFVKHMIRAGYFNDDSVDELAAILSRVCESQYEACKSEIIPEEVYVKFKHDFTATDILSNTSNSSPSNEVEQKLEYLSGLLNSDVYDLISSFIYRLNKNRQTPLTSKLITYIEVLHKAFNSNDTYKLTQSLHYIQADLCQRYTFITSESVIANFQLLIKHMIKAGYFKEGAVDELASLLVRVSESQYKISKSELIPEEVSNKFSHETSAEEVFKGTLDTCCTTEIASRLEEHVNTFKIKKHHRAPLVIFLKQISASNPEWHKHPRIIQGELLKFRGNLLDDFTRGTAYGKFQNVKNSLEVLVKHGLLPQNLELPDNLRRCTNTQKVRKNNPLMCDINMYDETQVESYINTSKFIESLKNDLSNNLSILVTDAQAIVYEGYQKFCEKENIIAQSQFDEFINHPELLVDTKSVRSRKKVNPFYTTHPMRSANLIAYYDHFFGAMVYGNTQHEMTSLAISEKILGYLGLTPNVASAMQIIITEELGINPYSLYRVKISSDGHGLEFVQVDDEGSVRLKAIKPRARNTRTKHATGTIASLADTNAQDIDAAICLKMALDMTSRIRKSIGVKELWVCLSKKGATVASISSFQEQFQQIRKQASSNSAALQYATLKKVRSSKGVLIYLETNGDSLKTAAYFGNSVKTTLARYIPKYLTELIYRVKIRNFQKIFLFMAVSSDKYPSKSLNMSESDFKLQLKQAFNNPDMGGNLYEKLTKTSNENEVDSPLYFCVSDLNLQLAIKYAKHGEDKDLRENCKNVLNKIGEESPIIMKQLLRKAQIAVDQYK